MDFSSSLLLHGLLALLYSARATGTGYVENILENDTVCGLVNNLNVISLEDESALVIKTGPTIQRWTGEREFNCRFILTSPLEFGAFAVVQRMSFRRNAQGDCIDYVQFRHTEEKISIGDIINIKIRSPETWGPKICGNIRDRDDYHDFEFDKNTRDDELIRNSFIDHRGLIEFKIHLRNKSLDDDEELHFEIVFTLYRECDGDNGMWKSCGSRTCIYERFFHDGKLNCPYKDCKDESGCRPTTALGASAGLFNSTVGIKITAGLLIVLSVYFAFSWLLGCRGPRSFQVSVRSAEIQRVQHLEATTVPRESSATTHSSGACCKDRSPPLYDSLFPS
ncbi:Hypothetical protein CINCED_3A006859 [Cinara cedri]|uniref:Uncharacterized protein n=1 Tax=Cinara cedri TaxID=506608 RepID=A0A5E4NB95_9HEMI|nr:Hypothetical protein CINCED_3A006859 [Cinara cedri]